MATAPSSSSPPTALYPVTSPPSHFLRGSLHLLGWLVLQPSAWREYCARIDPPLAPGFAFVDLTPHQWAQPALRRVLLQGCGILPLLIGVLLGGLGVTWGRVVYDMTLGVIFGLTVALTISVFVGMGAALALGAACACFGQLLNNNYASDAPLGLGFGIAGALALTLMPRRTQAAPVLRVGRAVVGVVVVGVLIGIVFGVLALLTGSGQGGVRSIELSAGSVFTPFGLAPGFAISLSWGIASGVGAAIPAVIAIGARRHPWRQALVTGLAFGGLVVAVVTVCNTISGHTALGNPDMTNLFTRFTEAQAGGIFLSWYFILAYILGERLGGVVIGGITGALAGSVGWLAFWLMGGMSAIVPNLVSIVLGAMIGLTVVWWRPLLCWPLELTWATLLYQADRRRAGSESGLLAWHPAFWDEGQFLPISGLDEHLVLTAERHPAVSQAAFASLTATRQRWAVALAQIELDARHLEQCHDIQAIREAEHYLAATEAEHSINALLRSFRRLSQDVGAALEQQSTYNQRLALRAVEEQMDALLRELDRSSPYALRFRPIVSHWRQIVRDQLVTLATQSAVSREIDNPYIIGLPLTAQQEIFVGRTDVSAQIEQLLVDRRRPPLLLYGQRRMGKTSLLHNLSRLLPSTIVPLFVDLQGAASQARDHAGFLYSLSGDIIKAAYEQRAWVLPPLSYDQLQLDPFPFFHRWLDTVEAALGSHTALLELDEFETLDQALTAGHLEERAMLGMLRHLIQHRPRFKVLLAGAHTLEEIQRWGGYLINAQTVHISYLQPEEARQLIEQPVKDFALRYARAASRRVFDLTHGHPLLVQLLCAEMVAVKNEQALAVRRRAEVSDVELAAEAALRAGSLFFADIMYNQVDQAGQTTLRYLAAMGPEAVCDHTRLVAHAGADGAAVLARLLRRDLLERVNGGYRFQVELIRRWFALAATD
jgi:hypothetical protein